jgi:hypothetical protein
MLFFLTCVQILLNLLCENINRGHKNPLFLLLKILTNRKKSAILQVRMKAEKYPSVKRREILSFVPMGDLIY